MRRFRVILIVIGVVFVLGMAGGLLAWRMTGGAATAANHFLQTLAANPHGALAEASGVFRASTSAADLTALAGRFGLAHFRGASWSSRSVEGSTATLEGTVDLGASGTLPTRIVLVREGGAWRVQAIHAEGGGAAVSTAAPSARPGANEAKQLAQVSLMQLVEAIARKDFRGLQAAGAPSLRHQFSPDQIAAQFKPFTDANLDLTKDVLHPVTLTRGPAVDGDGQLTLAGYLPTPRQPWYFAFGYVHDEGSWQLVSMALSSKPE